MEGIQIEKGLKVIGGNKPLYIRLLGKFEAGTMDGELRDAIQAGDMPLIKDKAHAIKGAAANLGLEDIQNAALAIEAKIKSGQTVQPADDLAKAFDAACEQTRASLQKLLANPELLG